MEYVSRLLKLSGGKAEAQLALSTAVGKIIGSGCTYGAPDMLANCFRKSESSGESIEGLAGSGWFG